MISATVENFRGELNFISHFIWFVRPEEPVIPLPLWRYYINSYVIFLPQFLLLFYLCSSPFGRTNNSNGSLIKAPFAAMHISATFYYSDVMLDTLSMKISYVWMLLITVYTIADLRGQPIPYKAALMYYVICAVGCLCHIRVFRVHGFNFPDDHGFHITSQLLFLSVYNIIARYFVDFCPHLFSILTEEHLAPVRPRLDIPEPFRLVEYAKVKAYYEKNNQ